MPRPFVRSLHWSIKVEVVLLLDLMSEDQHVHQYHTHTHTPFFLRKYYYQIWSDNSDASWHMSCVIDLIVIAKPYKLLRLMQACFIWLSCTLKLCSCYNLHGWMKQFPELCKSLQLLKKECLMCWCACPDKGSAYCYFPFTTNQIICKQIYR